MGPARPDLARRSDPDSIHAALPGPSSPYRSIFGASAAARELATLFGGVVPDIRRDPKDALSDLLSPVPSPTPFVTQAAPSSPTRAAQSGAVFALCPSALQSCLVLAEVSGPHDVSAAMADLSRLSERGFHVAAAAVLPSPASGLPPPIRGPTGTVLGARLTREGCAERAPDLLSAAGHSRVRLVSVSADLDDSPESGCAALGRALGASPGPEEAARLVWDVGAARRRWGLPEAMDTPLSEVCEVAVVALVPGADPAAVLPSLLGDAGGAGGLEVLGVRVEPSMRAAVRRCVYNVVDGTGKHTDGPFRPGGSSPVGRGSMQMAVDAAVKALHGSVALLAVYGPGAHARLHAALEEAVQAVRSGTTSTPSALVSPRCDVRCRCPLSHPLGAPTFSTVDTLPPLVTRSPP